MSKHGYYYKAKTGRKGRLASTQTIKQDDDGCICLVDKTVVDQIVESLEMFICENQGLD